MTKRLIMLAMLGGVFLFGTACFRLFTQKDESGHSQIEACKGLSGQAKTDCEKRSSEADAPR